MPEGDVTDLGSRLARLLLWSGLWGLLGAIGAAALWWTVLRPRLAQPGPRPLAEPAARRFLRLTLASLWVLDGVLQAQPLMPAGFVPMDIDPQVQAGPHWFAVLVAPLLRAWTRHPVAADVSIVWLEIGIGLLLIVGRHGLTARLAGWASMVAAFLIWTLGESFGSLLTGDASWLTGAPGAALVYALASALLFAPWTWWQYGRAQLLIRRGAALWLTVAAALQAIPADGYWRANGLVGPFADGAATRQPSWLTAPIRSLEHIAARTPGAMNGAIVLLLVAVALWLWVDGRTAALVTGIVLSLATWWLGQDFGMLGGTATDPNTALPLALLIAAALPAWSARPQSAASASRLRTNVRPLVVALALVLTAVVPGVLALSLVRGADSSALAADSAGGLRIVPARPAPPFGLVDQRGRRISMSGLRGKVVLLTFLDPVCTTECPVIANQLAIADRGLGGLADQVEFVAIDSNPIFHKRTDVAAFTDSHGLGGLPNWHFLCGSPEVVQEVLARYGITVDVPVVGMIEHSEGLFFIGPDGAEVAYLDDGAGAQLTETYAQQMNRQLRSMLR